MAPGLQKLREAIDQIDRQIVELLAERLRLVIKVGEIKLAHQLPVYDPKRERELIERVTSAVADPMTPGMAQRIFECIIQESRSLEQQHVTDSTPPPKP
jgi:monofunctional chorismate mutase